MDKIKTYLQKPFPLITNPKQNLIIALSFATTIYLFTWIFQPFHIYEMEEFMPVELYLVGYWLIVLFVFLIYDFIVPRFMPSYFNGESWTLGKMLSKILLIILTMAIFGYAYQLPLTMLYQPEKTITAAKLLSWFGQMIFFATSVSFFPIVILLMIIERFLLHRNQSIAERLTDDIHSHHSTKTADRITIPSNNKNEDIELYKQQLLCIKAEGNYADVFYADAGEIKSKLIRNTLTNIIADIEDMNIKRCQVSYIVNLDKVTNAYGSAQKINLQIEGLDFDIPVSRKFPTKDIFKSDKK